MYVFLPPPVDLQPLLGSGLPPRKETEGLLNQSLAKAAHNQTSRIAKLLASKSQVLGEEKAHEETTKKLLPFSPPAELPATNLKRLPYSDARR